MQESKMCPKCSNSMQIVTQNNISGSAVIDSQTYTTAASGVALEDRNNFVCTNCGHTEINFSSYRDHS